MSGKIPNKVKVNCQRCGKLAIEDGVRRKYVLRMRMVNTSWKYRNVELCKQCSNDLAAWAQQLGRLI